MKKLLLSTTLYFTCIFQLISQNIVTVNPQYKSTILEEFTGIHCGYCPDGHVIASGMYDANPDRVILINIRPNSFSNRITTPQNLNLETFPLKTLDSWG